MAKTQVNLTEEVQGTLPPGNGGTGLSSVGSSGNVLTSNGSVWLSQAPSGGSGNTVASTTTAAGTTTLTSASATTQVFTGSTTQTIVLPTTSVTAGQQWMVINQSTGAVTVNASGGLTALVMGGNSSAVFTAAVNAPTAATTDWDVQYGGVTAASGKVLTVNNSLTFSGTDGTTQTFPSTSGTVLSTASAIPAANLPDGITNANSALQSQVTVAGTAYYMAGSQIILPSTLLSGMSIPTGSGGTAKAGTVFHWQFAMTKTAAGTGAFNIILYRGTNGTTADTADVTQSIGTQTAVVDHMSVDVQLTVLTTGATGSYYWSIVPMNKAVTATGFGSVTGTLFSGTKTSVAMNTAGLIFGLGFSSTTGTPTITVPRVEAQSFNID